MEILIWIIVIMFIGLAFGDTVSGHKTNEQIRKEEQEEEELEIPDKYKDWDKRAIILDVTIQNCEKILQTGDEDARNMYREIKANRIYGAPHPQPKWYKYNEFNLNIEDKCWVAYRVNHHFRGKYPHLEE